MAHLQALHICMILSSVTTTTTTAEEELEAAPGMFLF
jgi:hypothetical protein